MILRRAQRLAPWGENPLLTLLFWPIRAWENYTARRYY